MRRAALILLVISAPNTELHDWHKARRLARSCVPPSASGTTWSAVLAGLPQISQPINRNRQIALNRAPDPALGGTPITTTYRHGRRRLSRHPAPAIGPPGVP